MYYFYSVVVKGEYIGKPYTDLEEAIQVANNYEDAEMYCSITMKGVHGEKLWEKERD